MVSMYDILHDIRIYQKSKEFPFQLSEDEKSIIDKVSNKIICSTEDYLIHFRRKLHCDFESIYTDPVSLTSILKCRECGTVIFASDRCEDYDKDCRCPVCCKDDSVCHYEVWTRSEIESDVNKSEYIKYLTRCTEKKIREHERMKKRGGLYDHERWRKQFESKNRIFRITCINWSYDGDTKKSMKPVDRFLEVEWWMKTKDRVHSFKVPLSFHMFYMMYIYPYSKKMPSRFQKISFLAEKAGG